MAFGKKKRKFSKIIKGIFWFLGIILVVFCLGVLFYQGIWINYKNEMDRLKMEAYELKKEVFIAKEDLKAGAILGEDNLYEGEVHASLLQNRFMTKEDFGKVLLIDLAKDEVVMTTMVFDEKIENTVREEELNMVLLPSNLSKNQYIDLRIGFPNGEDYIVLSKKKIQNLELAKNTIWLWVEEKEILSMSSAIVDAYLHKGSKLYTVTYVLPSLQDEAVATYPVNNDVLKLIKSNPNILEEAKKGLSEEIRKQLDERLKALSTESTDKIHTGVTNEAKQREDKIATEKEESKEEPTMEDEEIEDFY